MPINVRKATELQDCEWDDLITKIDQGEVVPVVGPELLFAEEEGQAIPFYDAVVRRLAKRLDVSIDGNSLSLTDLRHEFLRDGSDVVFASELGKVLDEMKDEPQAILKKLAGISGFRLFLSTTPDSLLSVAIRQVFSKNPDEYFFSKNRMQQQNADLPETGLESDVPAVYHLFGMPSGRFVDYAVSDDKKLEYLYLWADGYFRPTSLMRYLKTKTLLLLGCGYENWLTRFFLYVLKTENLIGMGKGVLADASTSSDAQLGRFLTRCKYKIYYKGAAAEFIDELVKRMGDYRSVVSRENTVQPERSVFISYASEDRAVALKVLEQLESKGISVWFDRKKLESGDAWDEKIKLNIENAALFVPILSRTTTECKAPRYFRKEWRTAIEKAGEFPVTIPFINPIAIGNVNPKNINPIPYPKALIDQQWIATENGELTESSLLKMRDLWSQSVDAKTNMNGEAK